MKKRGKEPFVHLRTDLRGKQSIRVIANSGMNSLPSWPACKAQLFLLIVIALAAKNSCVAFEVNGSNRDLARLNDQSVSIFGDKHNQRLLQQQQPSLFSFRAQYRAQFHQWIDPECEESSPLIRVACRGSYITIQNKSHPSIVCGTTVQQDDDNWSYLECKNTCTSNEECSEVYLAIGGIIADGNFGEISFQCESNDFEEVEAAVYWNASSGSCSSDPGLADPVSTIWHFLRLGIFCPVTQETESTIVYYNRSDYIYDDYFFECWFGRLIDFFEPHHFYTCFGGETCFEHDCVYDTIDEFAVRATLPAFQSQCIEPGVPVTNIATSSPETPTVQFLPYTSARFEARWGILVQSTCSTSSPMVRISCLNGEISDVSPTVKSISCTDFSSGVIDCVDSDLASGEDKFTGVTYVSIKCVCVLKYCVAIVALLLTDN